MFEIGDLILYGSTGVCRVTDIREQEFSGTVGRGMFYTLTPLYQNCIISAPVNSTKIFMRPIISKAEANRLIDRIPGMRGEAYHSRALHQLIDHYEGSMKTHDCADLIELTMSIYAKKQYKEQQKQKFGATDKRFMKKAEELLFGELAAALGIPKENVSDYITQRIGEGKENE